MIKKLILLFILLFPFQASAWNPMVVTSGTEAADPCATMGASGTYVLWWNGEYAGDTDKACLNSGTSTADGTADAGVINTTTPIAGTTDALLDADNEDITWTITTPNTLHQAGTLECQVKTPASFAAADALFIGVATAASSSDNSITAYTAGDTGRFYGRVEAAGVAEIINAYSQMTVSTTHTVYYTWRANVDDKHCTKLDAGAWACSTEALPDIATGLDIGFVGEGANTGVVVAGTWQVDNCKIREGYEGD